MVIYSKKIIALYVYNISTILHSRLTRFSRKKNVRIRRKEYVIKLREAQRRYQEEEKNEV